MALLKLMDIKILRSKIKVIEDDVTKRYKKEIDQAFNGL